MAWNESNKPSSPPYVWGDDDGETWYYEGRLSLQGMVGRVRDHEVDCVGRECYDEEWAAVVESGHVTYCWIVDDAADEERLVNIRGFWRVFWARLFLGARPLTTLHAGSGIQPPTPGEC